MRRNSKLLEQLRTRLAPAVDADGLRGVARRAGVDVATLAKFVHKERGLSVDATERLAEAVGYRVVLVKLDQDNESRKEPEHGKRR